MSILRKAVDALISDPDFECTCGSGVMLAEGEKFGMCPWCTLSEAVERADALKSERAKDRPEPFVLRCPLIKPRCHRRQFVGEVVVDSRGRFVKFDIDADHFYCMDCGREAIARTPGRPSTDITLPLWKKKS